MITVIASVRLSPGNLPGYLRILKDNMVAVRKENGCIEYYPAVDTPAGLPAQILDENLVTIIEKWDNIGALKAHLESAHMQAYRAKVKHMVEAVHLKILNEA